MIESTAGSRSLIIEREMRHPPEKRFIGGLEEVVAGLD